MSLRERGKEAKRVRLLRAAARLFSTRGYASTTVREIARAARVATGTVFLYARDKQALLAMVFAEEVASVQSEALAALDDSDPFERKVMALFGAFYRYYGRDPELSRVFLKELAFPAERSEPVATVTRDFMGAIAALVREAQAARELRSDADPDHTAAVLFAVYWACLMAWLGGALPSAEAAIAQLERSLALVIGGLAPARSRPRYSVGSSRR